MNQRHASYVPGFSPTPFCPWGCEQSYAYRVHPCSAPRQSSGIRGKIGRSVKPGFAGDEDTRSAEAWNRMLPARRGPRSEEKQFAKLRRGLRPLSPRGTRCYRHVVDFTTAEATHLAYLSRRAPLRRTVWQSCQRSFGPRQAECSSIVLSTSVCRFNDRRGILGV